MARTISSKIVLDGEKEFRASIRNIKQDASLLKADMKLLSAEYKNNGDRMNFLVEKQGNLKDQIDNARKSVETHERALKQSSEKYGDNSKQAKNWEIELLKAKTTLTGLEGELKKTDAEMDELENSTNQNKDSLDRFGDSANDAGKKSSLLGDIIKGNLISSAVIGGLKMLGGALKDAMGGAIDFAKDGIGYNSMIEDYTMSFTTMTGSAEQAKDMMDQIKKTAKETPFEIDGMSDSVKQMMSYGIDGQKAIDITKMLGDVSQGNNEKMNSMAYAMGQISAQGKLNAQDLNQLINAGFNPLEEMSKKSGKSMAELKDEMSKGLITYADVEDALKGVTSEGGRFHGAMENASQTFSGQTAMMEEGVNNLKGLITESFTDLLGGSVMPMINGWIDELTEGFETDGMDGLIRAFKNVLGEAIDWIKENLSGFLDTGIEVIKAIAEGVGSALPTIIDALMEVLGKLGGAIIDNLPEIVTGLVNIGKDIVGGLIKGILTTNWLEVIGKIFDAIVGGFKALFGIQSPSTVMAEIGGFLIEGLINGLGSLMDGIGNIVGTVGTFIVDGLKGALGFVGDIAQGAINLGSQFIGAVGDGINSIKEGVGSVFESVGNFLFGETEDELSQTKGASVGSNFGQGLRDGLNSQRPNAGVAGQDLGNHAKNGANGVSLYNTGVQMGLGFEGGINSRSSAVWNTAYALAGQAIRAANQRLQVKSPSRVFHEIGAFTSEGLALGIRDKAHLAVQEMNKLNDDLIGSMGHTQSGLSLQARKNQNLITISGNNFVINNEMDVEKVAEDLARFTQMKLVGVGA